MLILTGFLGIFGFLAATIAITLHLLSLRSFGAPYLAPIAPFRKPANKDIFIRLPWWKMKTRPLSSKPQDKVRQQEDDLKPEPPSPN